MGRDGGVIMNQVIITEYSVMKHVFGGLEPVAIFYIIYCYVFLSPSCVLRSYQVCYLFRKYDQW